MGKEELIEALSMKPRMEEFMDERKGMSGISSWHVEGELFWNDK